MRVAAIIPALDEEATIVAVVDGIDRDLVDAVVVGIPDRKFGEMVKAYVVARKGWTLAQSALSEHCRKSLASFKVPTSIEFRAELPRTLIGKALRRVLRDEEVGRAEQPRAVV